MLLDVDEAGPLESGADALAPVAADALPAAAAVAEPADGAPPADGGAPATDAARPAVPALSLLPPGAPAPPPPLLLQPVGGDVDSLANSFVPQLSELPEAKPPKLPPPPSFRRPPPGTGPAPSLVWDPTGYGGPAPDLAVVIGYHSPAGYVRPRINLLYVLSTLERMDVPTFLVELAYPNQRHTFESYNYTGAGAQHGVTVLKVRSSSYMFHKETLWNRAVQAAPPHITKFLFLDGDVVFHETNWPRYLSYFLDKADVVQPFRYAIWRGTIDLNAIKRIRPSMIYDKLRHGSTHVSNSHPGYAIAARRDWLNRIGGWFPCAVEGGGDSFNMDAILNRPLESSISSTNNAHILRHYRKWRMRVRRHVPRIAAAPWDVSHLAHGSRKNRGYRTRHAGHHAESGDYSFSFNADGVLEFTDPSLSKSMLRYFRSRLEDA